ncbi:MAG: tRNA pseudouridine38-40 synthase [Flavobacteriales bacterium]|jgi:tRNA pseudouridine38-40 synthase
MRYFIHLAYDGGSYLGWQIQPEGSTVQGEINRTLKLLLQEEIETVGCGRTDTGVHASDFYLHFEGEEDLDTNWLAYKMNQILPHSIAVFDCFQVEEGQHARFSATSRSYQYHLHLRKDPFLNEFSVRCYYDLDLDVMNEAGEWLCAQTDFASFCKAGGNQNTTFCKVTRCEFVQEGHKIVFHVTADRFLRNMVRSLVGTLVDLGRGKINLEELKEIVGKKNRSAAGTSMAANGLFLTRVTYPFL